MDQAKKPLLQPRSLKAKPSQLARLLSNKSEYSSGGAYDDNGEQGEAMFVSHAFPHQPRQA